MGGSIVMGIPQVRWMVYFRENRNLKWMMNRGALLTVETPVWKLPENWPQMRINPQWGVTGSSRWRHSDTSFSIFAFFAGKSCWKPTERTSREARKCSLVVSDRRMYFHIYNGIIYIYMYMYIQYIACHIYIYMYTLYDVYIYIYICYIYMVYI